LRSDNGGEFTSDYFKAFCEEVRIKRELTTPYNPQHNSVAERKNRMILEEVKAMIHDQDLPMHLWAKAARPVVYVQNGSRHCILENKTPEEMFKGEKPEVGHLRIFGCRVYVHVPKDKRSKLDPSGKKGIFVGYSETSKAYRVYIPGHRQIETSRDVTFDEEVYVEQPHGFKTHDRQTHVCRLKKALYGLKQSPRAWYDRIGSFLMSLGFTKSKANSNLYYEVVDGKSVILLLYVDDLFLTEDNKLIAKSKRKLATEFEMKDLSMMHYFLGLEVWQKPDEILLNQGKYAIEILKRFGMMDCKSMPTPKVTNLKLLSDTSSETVDATMYRQMIGSLMYLTNTRPDICFSMNTLSQYMVEPRRVHLIIEKHVLRYLKGTVDYGLRYTSDREIRLQGYANSDWVGSVANQKSTSRCCFNLGLAMISWLSKKQTSVALTTAKAEYITACSASSEAMWLRNLLAGLFDLKLEVTCISCDNQSCIKLSENPVFHDKSKHIKIKYHCIRDMVQKGVVTLQYIATNEQIVDVLTKPLSKIKFEYFIYKLGVVHKDFPRKSE
jgi:hypothetical protein